jgi:uncharacterized protein
MKYVTGMADVQAGQGPGWFEVDDDGPFDPDSFRAFLVEERFRRRESRQRADLPSLGFIRRTVVGGIRAYQREVSPRLMRECVFEPSCSTYAELAVARNGVFRGAWETWRRLRRCRPENEGMTDYPKGVSNALPSDPDRQELQ